MNINIHKLDPSPLGVYKFLLILVAIILFILIYSSKLNPIIGLIVALCFLFVLVLIIHIWEISAKYIIIDKNTNKSILVNFKTMRKLLKEGKIEKKRWRYWKFGYGPPTRYITTDTTSMKELRNELDSKEEKPPSPP